MNKVIAGLLCLLAVILVFCTVFFSCFPVGRTMWNSWFFAVQKADDATAYSTRKQVEDTCRAMMTSYTSDSLIYQQYKTAKMQKSCHGLNRRRCAQTKRRQAITNMC